MTYRYQKGSILVFSVLMLAVIMAISLGLAKIFLPKIRSITDTENSVAAVFAADSGAELCLYEIRKGAVPSPLANPLLTNSAVFTIASMSSPEVDITNDCSVLGTSSYRFRVSSSYRGVTRAFEVSQ